MWWKLGIPFIFGRDIACQSDEQGWGDENPVERGFDRVNVVVFLPEKNGPDHPPLDALY